MVAQIRVENAEITFTRKGAEPVTALQNMNLGIAPGAFVAVVGPSGCGKTTLLRAVAGLQPTTSGAVLVGGESVERPRRETGVMFQAPTLLPWLTVLGNCLLPHKLSGGVREEHRQRARELLARTGLAEFEKSYPSELSGGMQQRAALCRALGTRPSLLLLDEPFGALDAMTREQMNLDLHAMWLRESVTTLLITHSIPEAVFLSQRVVVMSQRPGRVLEIVDVPLPKERDVSVMADEVFTRTCAHIRSYFTGGQHHVID